MDMGKIVLLIIGMLLLIFDSRNALLGAQEGIELCLRVVIPSIFPMMFLARLLTSQQWNGPKWLSRLFYLPPNSQSLLIAGILSGYPVGAQLVGNAHKYNRLQSADARRMLCVCSNCGPAFLFGMTAQLFDQHWISWALWVILLLSSIITSWIIPDIPGTYRCVSTGKTSISQDLIISLKAMGNICGWVVLFRVILKLWNHWTAGRLPKLCQIAIGGLLELSNGCISLNGISNMGIKFVLCGLFMSFGGICVLLQILGVSQDVDMSAYFPGKIFQSLFCVLLTYFVQLLSFSSEDKFTLPLWSFVILTLIMLLSAYFLRKTKNTSRILETVGV